MVVRPKHIGVNWNKIVNNYWNSVALDGNPWTWLLFTFVNIKFPLTWTAHIKVFKKNCSSAELNTASLRQWCKLGYISAHSQSWHCKRVSDLSKSKLLYDWRSVSMSQCLAHSGTCGQILVPVWKLLSYLNGAPSLTRRRVCNLQRNHSMVWVEQNP
jgi:hypothetical protein